MYSQDRKRLLVALSFAVFLHLLLLILRFTAYSPLEDSQDYRGPVSITFAQDLLDPEPPGERPNQDQEPLPAAQELPGTSAPEQGNPSAPSQDEKGQEEPVPQSPGQESPTPDPVSPSQDPVPIAQAQPQDMTGRQHVPTDSEPQRGPQAPTNSDTPTSPSLDLGDLSDILSDPESTAPTATPGTQNQEEAHGLRGDIRNLRILFSKEPQFNFDIVQGILAFKITVLQDGSVIFQGIDFSASDEVFSRLYSEAQLEGPMRAAISQWRLSAPPGNQTLSGVGTIRIKN